MRIGKRLLAIGLLSLPAALPAQWAYYHEAGKPQALIKMPDGAWIVACNENIFKLSAAGQVLWGQKFCSGVTADSSWAAWATPDGGIVAAWDEDFSGTTIQFKLSAAGTVVWQKSYTLDGARLNVFAPSPDGGTIMAGSLDDDLLVCRCGPDGEIVWQWTYGTDLIDEASVAAATPDGGLVVLASSRLPDNPDGSQGEADLWVLKLDAAGGAEWQKRIGGPADDIGDSVVLTADGGYLITGWSSSFRGGGQYDLWLLKLSAAGLVERADTLNFQGGAVSGLELKPVGDGTFVAAIILAQSPAEAVVVVQIGRDGAVIREKAIAPGYDSLFDALAIPTEDGGILLSMTEGWRSFWPSSNAHLVKFSPSWDIDWQKSFGGDYSSDSIQFLDLTDDGGYLMAGTTGSWGGLCDALWLMRTLPDGSIGPNCYFIKDAGGPIVAAAPTVLEAAAAVTDTLAVPQAAMLVAADADVEVTPWGPATLPALGGPTCTLTLRASMSGGTATPPWGDHVYATGTEVHLSVSTKPKYTFAGWSGNVITKGSSITIVMDGDKVVTADFTYHPDIDEAIDEARELGCFVATAAYGDPSHPDVETLRRFRDRHLMKSRFGRAFVKLYYIYSPRLADFVAKRPALRAISRAALSPVVAACRFLLGL